MSSLKQSHDIEKICRAFLWSGDFQTCKHSQVAWNDVCKPKASGGLGIRDIQMWNIAFMGKHAWSIAAKEDNLWIKWVHSIYIKEVGGHMFLLKIPVGIGRELVQSKSN